MAGSSIVCQRVATSALRDAMQSIEQHEAHITLAVKRKGMTGTNTRRVVANALSTEPVIEESAAAAHSLGAQAERLAEVVSVFEVGVPGSTSAA